MKLSDDVKGAVAGFLILLCKGLIDDERWDWDVEKCDWKKYQEAFCESWILRSTIAIFLNNLNFDKEGKVEHTDYVDARFRAFCFFRMYGGVEGGGKAYEGQKYEFEPWEFVEQPWIIWEE